jgi:hypothetical protein
VTHQHDHHHHHEMPTSGRALSAVVPGATVIRVETDSEGSPYEAQLRKTDGTEVTVKVDKDYSATDVQSGFGAH